MNTCRKFLFRSVLLIVFAIASVHVQASFDNNQQCLSIYNELFALHFDKAGQLIAKEKSTHPANSYVYALEGYTDFLKTFLSETDANFESYKINTEKRLEILRNEDASSPYFLLCQAEIIMQRALTRGRFNEFFYAAMDVRKSYKLILENQHKFPDFKPNLKTLGLIHAVIGSIPQNYQWVIKIAGMQGTIKQGVGELHQLLDATKNIKEYKYLKNETLLYLIFVESHLNKNKEESFTLLNLYDKNVSNQLITFSHVNTYYTFSNNDEAIKILEARQTDSDAFTFSYLDYIYGIVKLNRLDANADIYLKKYIQEFKGKSFLKSAYQKLAWHALAVKNDKALYNSYINKVANTGDDFADEDKQAEKEFKTKSVPNVMLLRSRLLFDGGYYLKAMQEIAGKPMTNFSSKKDQLELIYRSARIFDMINEKAKAIDFYLKTISLGQNQQYYYAANSALNLGYIYELNNNKIMAEKYYRQCLSMRNHEYQNSIDQKAKSGLDRIGAQ